VNVHKEYKELRKLYREKYCLHPEAKRGQCEGKIVNAHTIGRKKALEKIARNGHLITFSTEPGILEKTSGLGMPKMIGVKEASTFTGFCSRHDRETFKPIDEQELLPTPEQVFLVSYRGFCRELYYKNAVNKKYQKDRKSKKLILSKHKEFVDDFSRATSVSLRRLIKRKSSMDSMLLENQYTDLKYLAITFKDKPEIACSGTFCPEYDFNGKFLQDLSDLIPDFDAIMFNLIPTEKGGMAIFSWIDYDSVNCYRLIKSLLDVSKNRIPDAILRMAFEYIDNVYIDPNWWEPLGRKLKIELTMLANSGMLVVPRIPTGIIPDKIQFVFWRLDEIITNL
jgi:hypothetical protein